MDDDVMKSIMEAANDPDKQAPALLGQSFLKHFDYSFDSDAEVLILKRPDTGETDRIPLVKHGGVYWLDATFNGGKSRRLVYDTGASSISLSLLMAAELGLAPQPSDPEVMVQVADGRLVKAKRKKIGAVKVGRFTVTDVEATIEIPGSNVHTVGYWDKPDNKDIKNWMGVVTPKSIDPLIVYPKEQRLIDICKLHKAAGHQVWVYCQMTGKRNVMPRLKQILEREGLKVGILKSGDVDPKEREAWIADNGRAYDVMICFPKLVSTGLDLFSKVQGGHNYNCIVFYETGYNLNDMRQAARRAWRIGQPRDCFIYYMYYQNTMQHRAMSLMSRKMSAALALEGEFSEEGLAALSGEGDEQMALAKSMSEKIDDADMQRSWNKVKSMAEKKKPAKKKPVDAIAAMAKDAKPSPLDNLSPEEQLMASTILERQGQPVPEEAKAGIAELAARLAAADDAMQRAAEMLSEGDEVSVEVAAKPEMMDPIEAIFADQGDRRDREEAEIRGVNAEIISVDESASIEGLGEKLMAEVDDYVNGRIYSVEPWSSAEQAEAELAALEAMIVNPPEPINAEVKPTLKVHRPEPVPAPKARDPFDPLDGLDDLVFDDEKLAAMMANMASHGMTAEDIFG